eukprot:TRINITY_DN39223_c0_g1_i1.p1 TRINITY_DN39223_c0_g1~~TRINITY_DN39223_c0_g1_i1.p1  ORF type:complete len:229 (+),score=43.28 TRINITY_DN39223_c0_g1_i1:45-731(+)
MTTSTGSVVVGSEPARGSRESRFGRWVKNVSKSTEVDADPETSDGQETDLRPIIPRWFRVVYAKQVAVRKKPSIEAPSVAFLDAGEIIEVSELQDSWVRLSDSEHDARGISEDCQGWVLRDGRSVSLGVLLEPFEPCWFQVVFGGKVAVRKKPTVTASPVFWLEKKEYIEISEIVDGWVKLSDDERRSRDISDDCGAWVIIDATSKGLGRLLAVSPVPDPSRNPKPLT